MNTIDQKSTILIVDDVPENIDVLRGILKHDYKLKIATDGEKALKIANGLSKPDLILLDVMMPGMDGYEVCRRLKSHCTTAEIPVIFVTAKGDVKDERHGFELGAVDYITKPVNPALVLSRVNTHLSLYNQKRLLNKQMDAQVEAEEKIRLLLTSVGEGIFGVGTDGLVDFINRVALEMLGFDENEVLGQKIHPLIHHTRADGSHYPVEECPMFEALSKGKICHIENEVLWRKDGSSFPVEYKARPILKDSTITGSVVTFSDITEREMARQQLINEIADRKQSEHIAEHAKQKLESITNSIPGVVYQFHYDQNTINFTYISYGIEQLQYIKPEQVLADFNHFLQSVYPQDRDIITQAINHSTKTLEPLSCEYRVVNSDNSFKWIQMKSSVSKFSDKSKGVFLFNDHDILTEILFNGNLIDITIAKNAHELLQKQQLEIQEIHKHTRESIEYAALIQGSLIPDNRIFKNYFQDSFAIWHPKDIVGGDIYLMEQINEQEVVIMVIDCTGHGVPGAFVTMLVKAIERQITANLHKDDSISPANMLIFFNRTIKNLLQQEDNSSISNAGFDGGILYYNKNEKIVRFAGANLPLFIIQNDELKTIKGDRHSIGYKKSDADFVFKDHQIDVNIPSQIYLSTDGYLDQNGGNKGFPFGKKRFTQLIMENHHETFADQQELLLYELQNYQKDYERNDDVTLIGLKV